MDKPAALRRPQLQTLTAFGITRENRSGETMASIRRMHREKQRMHWLRKTFATLSIFGAPASAQLTSAQLNYPPAALRAGHEGAVGYEVKVAKDGKVTGCRVTETSGFADLDQQTCAQLRQTARFKPTVSANGKPIAATYANRLRWRIPRPVSEPTPVIAPTGSP